MDMHNPVYRSDVQTEAARQIWTRTEDPDLMGVGEAMEGQSIQSSVEAGIPTAWGNLGAADFEAAQTHIHDAISTAANLSMWSVGLGVHGLYPHENHLQGGGYGDAQYAILFAFSPEVSDATKEEMIAYIARGIEVKIAAESGVLDQMMAEHGIPAEKIAPVMGDILWDGPTG